ncbi:hypothetical protein [Candidatus Magnetaquicoccus inordinatus]|uniref:hypothetical protein n=1 Tax=Candidatus Magnetaquicoccus inordinatus TaxID=2496818 RepID=UPI001D0E41AB|nr:hypothetical protein [Candidatus Magnetaquicoccus inordinatus]
MSNKWFAQALRAAELVNAAKKSEELAWHNWLTAETPANKLAFLSARTAWLQAVRAWKQAVHQAEIAANGGSDETPELATSPMDEQSLFSGAADLEHLDSALSGLESLQRKSTNRTAPD